MIICINFDHASAAVKSGILAGVENYKNELMAVVQRHPEFSRQISSGASFFADYTVDATVDDREDCPARIRALRTGLELQMWIYPGASRDTVLKNDLIPVIPRKSTLQEAVEYTRTQARLAGFRMTDAQSGVFLGFVLHQLRSLYTDDMPRSGMVFSMNFRQSEVFKYDGQVVQSRCCAIVTDREFWLSRLGCESDGVFAAKISVAHAQRRLFSCAFVLPVSPPADFFPPRMRQMRVKSLVHESQGDDLNRRFVQRECFGCGVGGCAKMCSKCKRATYCSAECQKRDWRNHKEVCEFFSSS